MGRAELQRSALDRNAPGRALRRPRAARAPGPGQSGVLSRAAYAVVPGDTGRPGDGTPCLEILTGTGLLLLKADIPVLCEVARTCISSRGRLPEKPAGATSCDDEIGHEMD